MLPKAICLIKNSYRSIEAILNDFSTLESDQKLQTVTRN